MSAAPIVSVVVPTYNRPDTLRDTLASLAAQTLVDDIEVVVVNDGGCDVADVVATAQDRLRVRLETLPQNSGVAAALNAGIQLSNGSWLGICGDDDLFLPDHVEVALAAARQEGTEVAYTDCAVAHQRISPAALVPGSLDGLPVAHVWDLPWSPELLLVGDFIPIINVLIRRFPGDDIRFPIGMATLEDWEVLLDLAHRRGYRFAHVGRPTTIYHRPVDCRSYTADASRDVEALDQFRSMTTDLYRTWPVSSGSAAERGRRVHLGLYDEARKRLAAGLPVSHFHYEKASRVVADVVAGRRTPEEGRAMLARTVLPDEFGTTTPRSET